MLVVGIPGGGPHDEALREVAEAVGVMHLAYPHRPAYTLDGLHLNAAGARQWQAAVEKALCPTL